MREAQKAGFHAVRGSTPTFNHEVMADEIVAALRRGKKGVNYRNGGSYWVTSFRGKKLYFCRTRYNANRGFEAFAQNLRDILAGPDYVNRAIAEHDQYYDLALLVSAKLTQSYCAHEQKRAECTYKYDLKKPTTEWDRIDYEVCVKCGKEFHAE